MPLPITLGTAALLGLMYVPLSILVTAARMRSGTGLGLGPEPDPAIPSPLLIASRRHAHFAEYVPMSLILLGLLESSGLARTVLLGFAGTLILARALLSFGINAKTPNPWRLSGNMLQWLVILGMSGTGAWLVFTR
jgi:uncharacterized membrane protein YecN with MAPEG domain